ncbi:hypothetical protein ACFW0U_32120, partial [Streptomyces albidoflavus]
RPTETISWTFVGSDCCVYATAANYCAAVSRIGWTPFLLATAVGSVPNTAAYVLAGSTAASPTSPVFLASAGFIALSALAASVFAWRRRHRLVSG